MSQRTLRASSALKFVILTASQVFKGTRQSPRMYTQGPANCLSHRFRWAGILFMALITKKTWSFEVEPKGEKRYTGKLSTHSVHVAVRSKATLCGHFKSRTLFVLVRIAGLLSVSEGFPVFLEGEHGQRVKAHPIAGAELLPQGQVRVLCVRTVVQQQHTFCSWWLIGNMQAAWQDTRCLATTLAAIALFFGGRNVVAGLLPSSRNDAMLPTLVIYEYTNIDNIFLYSKIRTRSTHFLVWANFHFVPWTAT